MWVHHSGIAAHEGVLYPGASLYWPAPLLAGPYWLAPLSGWLRRRGC